MSIISTFDMWDILIDVWYDVLQDVWNNIWPDVWNEVWINVWNDVERDVSNDFISYPNFRRRFLHRFIDPRRSILRHFIRRILRSIRGKKWRLFRRQICQVGRDPYDFFTWVYEVFMWIHIISMRIRHGFLRILEYHVLFFCTEPTPAAPKYLENIVTILLCLHRIWRMQYFPNIAKTSKYINNIFSK